MMIQAPLKEIPGAFSTPKMKVMPGKGFRRGKKLSLMESQTMGRKPHSSPPSQSAGTVNAGKAALLVGDKRQRSAPINISPSEGQRKQGMSSPVKKISAHQKDPRASPTNYAGAKFSESPSAKELPPPPLGWVLDSFGDVSPPLVTVGAE